MTTFKTLDRVVRSADGRCGLVIRQNLNADGSVLSVRVRWDDDSQELVAPDQLQILPMSMLTMTPERAEEIRKTIWKNRGSSKVGRDMTGEEDTEIRRFWTRLEGTTSFYDAVSRMAKGEHLK